MTREVLDSAGLRALDAAAWDRLSETALVENPFYSRPYVLAGLDTIDSKADLKAIAIRDADGHLAGLFPFRPRVLAPFPWPVAEGAENLYQPSGTPLVARDKARPVIDAWLDTLNSGESPRFWTMGHLDVDGAVKAVIDAGIAARSLTARVVVPYPRPDLTRHPGGLDAHKAHVIGKSRLKDIRRNLRRLSDMGEVTFERATDPRQVRERLEQFLALEQAGWKGERGTAFLSKEDDAAFARKAFGGEEREGLVSIDSLLLDGRPVAMAIDVSEGGTAFTPKCAYDETLRKASPGLVLDYLIIEHFYGTADHADMDAATTTGDHILLDLWNGQKQMGRLIVGPDDWRTSLLASGWETARAGKERVKKALGRTPGRCSSVVSALLVGAATMHSDA
jgi:CelD/BcsL family acetyltransferase involved in cellulose biosynthesis